MELGVLIAAGLAAALVLVIIEDRWHVTGWFRRQRRRSRRGRR